MNDIFSVILSAAAGIAVTAVFGFVLISRYGKSNGTAVFADNDKRQNEDKKILPYYGGILIIAGVLSATAVAVLTDKIRGGDIIAGESLVPSEMYTKFFSGIITAVMLAVVGFAEDKMKAFGINGFSLTQKFIILFVISVSYLVSLYMGMHGEPYMFVPFRGMIRTGLLFWTAGIIYILTAVNAVNLTDGFDGINSGPAALTAISLGIISMLRGAAGFAVISMALAGACTGYFVCNGFSSKLQTGKTGALFVAGIYIAISFSLNCPLVLPLCGASYILAGICEIVRVLGYSLFGKRLFRDYPLQFHLSECGWSKRKTGLLFMLINAVGSAAAGLILYMGGYFL